MLSHFLFFKTSRSFASTSLPWPCAARASRHVSLTSLACFSCVSAPSLNAIQPFFIAQSWPTAFAPVDEAFVVLSLPFFPAPCFASPPFAFCFFPPG
jgi:hypothetical protein